MWRSGGTKPESESPKLAAPRFRFRGPLRVLLTVALVLAVVVFVFPLVFSPGVQPPTDVQFGSPFSVPVQLSNQNVTPLTDVEYTCELSKLTLANSSPVKDANVLVRGSVRRIAGRKAVAARCQSAYIPNAPVQAAEYKLTVTYRAYPWPQRRRTSMYRIAAQIDSKGDLKGWKVN